ncbi:aspartate aminotransferase family protein [Thermosipho atlanticus]|uniref:Acetyldiaminopimelate aminotransferase apoenzyme n=1 Tax=Thermosipho atlanticus DSM 15807 TaxID=1123380 RepID=A0A1M5SJZ8_9BACT|nr:aminotransferase class III-fold pyridoxal phosphate-dependent enzyme [Thermosipho atlanticus]SHH38874.1 acetyldiaminopimelate aminotransferase apoenzyme [Thermosipho atlanticus DSM 15807]
MYIANTYRRIPIIIERGEGIWIYDTLGNKYLDTFSGIGVLSFGHCDEIINNAIREKISKFTHISNFFVDNDALFVAEKLVKETKKDGSVFFANSGAEANEAALKAVKKNKKGLIISFEGNFHGRTLGALSITGFPAIRKQFEPLLDNIVFLPFNDPTTLKTFLEKNGHKVSAIFVESIHGSGGLDVVNKEVINVINHYKNIYNYIIVADEVQAGLGRTGKFYSYQHFNLEADIITVAKSLGGGLPLAATIFTGKYKTIFLPGEHGSTFAPNPVALAAGKTVLQRITKDFLKEVEQKGVYLKKQLLKLKENFGVIKEIKGLGLMIGIVIESKKIDNIIEIGLREKILLNIVKGNTIRLLPPLDITIFEIDELLSRLKKVLSQL